MAFLWGRHDFLLDYLGALHIFFSDLSKRLFVSVKEINEMAPNDVSFF